MTLKGGSIWRFAGLEHLLAATGLRYPWNGGQRPSDYSEAEAIGWTDSFAPSWRSWYVAACIALNRCGPVDLHSTRLQRIDKMWRPGYAEHPGNPAKETTVRRRLFQVMQREWREEWPDRLDLAVCKHLSDAAGVRLEPPNTTTSTCTAVYVYSEPFGTEIRGRIAVSSVPYRESTKRIVAAYVCASEAEARALEPAILEDLGMQTDQSFSGAIA